MNVLTADLHIHTTCSDGTLTPREVVARAVKNGVGLLAVCDHDVVDGCLEAEPLALAAGLRFVRGVEIDSMLLGVDAHLLCYGADFSNGALKTLIRETRARLDGMSDDLLRRMAPDFPALDLDEYDRMPMDRRLGGWKLLQYLMKKGLTKRLCDGLWFYGRYDVSYAKAGFAAAETVVAAVHAAGGCAVLAHPGETFRPQILDDGLKAAHQAGIDGIECYYPTHSQSLTDKLLRFCGEKGLCVTAGSDCHGAFGDTDVGETKTPIEALNLRSIAFS